MDTAVGDVRDSGYIWSVIEFVNTDDESNSVEVVPTSWVIFTSDKIMCKWPGKNARKFILREEPPKDNWQKYTVQLILQSDSYKEALDVVQKKTRTDTSDTCSQLGRGKRKKKTKSQPSVTENNLGDDDSDFREMTPPPPITDADVIDLPLETRLPLNNLINDNNKNLDKRMENINKTAINVDQNKADTVLEEFAILEDPETANPINDIIATNIIFEDLPTDSQNIVSILQNTITIKKLLEQQNTFLAQLNNTNYNTIPLLSASSLNSNNTNNFSIIPNKPFKKFTKLLDYDTALKTNEEQQKQLETFFYLLGGTSPQDQIKAGLQKVFTNKLGTKCSWMGRKGNFEVKTLIIMDILKRSTRKHFPFLTEKQFQGYVSIWFRHSKTRYDRELAKQQPRQ